MHSRAIIPLIKARVTYWTKTGLGPEEKSLLETGLWLNLQSQSSGD